MTHSFPHRMIAVPARILLALFTDPLATVADVAAYAALALMFAGLSVLIVRVEHWIARHVADRALDREYAALCDTYSPDNPGDTEHLPGVTRIGPATPPPVRRAVRRRRMAGVRIPGRPRMHRHTQTSSSSDRRTRS